MHSSRAGRAGGVLSVELNHLTRLLQPKITVALLRSCLRAAHKTVSVGLSLPKQLAVGVPRRPGQWFSLMNLRVTSASPSGSGGGIRRKERGGLKLSADRGVIGAAV